MDLMKFLPYLLVMAGVTYLIRVIPFVLINKKIENRFLNSFLYYIPYTVTCRNDISCHTVCHRKYAVSRCRTSCSYIYSIQRKRTSHSGCRRMLSCIFNRNYNDYYIIGLLVKSKMTKKTISHIYLDKTPPIFHVKKWQ